MRTARTYWPYQALATGSKANRYTSSPVDNRTRLNLREDKSSTFRELEIKATLFQGEESLLERESATVADKEAVFPDHSMTGNNYRNRICANCSTDRPGSMWPADCHGNLTIRFSLSVGNL